MAFIRWGRVVATGFASESFSFEKLRRTAEWGRLECTSFLHSVLSFHYLGDFLLTILLVIAFVVIFEICLATYSTIIPPTILAALFFWKSLKGFFFEANTASLHVGSISHNGSLVNWLR